MKTYMGAIDTRAQKEAGDKAKIDKEEIVQELVHYGTKYVEEMHVYGPHYQGSNYLGQLLYLKSPEKWTITVAINSLIGGAGLTYWGKQMAMSVISLLPL